MTHGDPSAGHVPPRSTGRQTPMMAPAGNGDSHPASGGEDSAGNTPMSAKMGKMMSVRVLMLDDSITVFQIQVREICFSPFFVVVWGVGGCTYLSVGGSLCGRYFYVVPFSEK